MQCAAAITAASFIATTALAATLHVLPPNRSTAMEAAACCHLKSALKHSRTAADPLCAVTFFQRYASNWRKCTVMAATTCRAIVTVSPASTSLPLGATTCLSNKRTHIHEYVPIEVTHPPWRAHQTPASSVNLQILHLKMPSPVFVHTRLFMHACMFVCVTVSGFVYGARRNNRSSGDSVLIRQKGG